MPFPALPIRSPLARRLIAATVAAVIPLTAVACGSDSTDDASATRTYDSDFGPVEIPANPEDIQRIVSVDFYTPAALVDLGITPVGVVQSYFDDGAAIPEHYRSEVTDSGATSIGEYYELDVEAVSTTDPDLILATDDFLPLDDPLRDKLESIAPIITFKARDGESWRTRSTELADILDREDALEPLVADYNSRRDEIAERYSNVLDNETFAVFVPTADEWGTYADTHFSTPILRDLGAHFREQRDDEINENGFPNWFSYEELGRLDNVNVIFTPVTDRAVLDKVEGNELWKRLPAVRNGLVFEYIPDSPTGSYGWALENLDALDDLLGTVSAAR